MKWVLQRENGRRAGRIEILEKARVGSPVPFGWWARWLWLWLAGLDWLTLALATAGASPGGVARSPTETFWAGLARPCRPCRPCLVLCRLVPRRPQAATGVPDTWPGRPHGRRQMCRLRPCTPCTTIAPHAFPTEPRLWREANLLLGRRQQAETVDRSTRPEQRCPARHGISQPLDPSKQERAFFSIKNLGVSMGTMC